MAAATHCKSNFASHNLGLYLQARSEKRDAMETKGEEIAPSGAGSAPPLLDLSSTPSSSSPSTNKPDKQQQQQARLSGSGGDPLLSASDMCSLDDVFGLLSTSRGGLSIAEVRIRLRDIGKNVITELQPTPGWKVFLEACVHPFNLLLLVLACTSGLTGDHRSMAVLSSMVFISIILRFWQEYKSIVAAESLKSLITKTVRVIRQGSNDILRLPSVSAQSAPASADLRQRKATNEAIYQPPLSASSPSPSHISTMKITSKTLDVPSTPQQLQRVSLPQSTVLSPGSYLPPNSTRYDTPFEDIVPGDVISLSSGDIVPADCRLIASKNLLVNQSSITGESLSVEKNSDSNPPSNADALKLTRNNLLFMGTSVESGSAIAVVVCTGNQTYFGVNARKLVKRNTDSAFARGVRQLSYLFIGFLIAMTPLVFAVNVYTKGDWMQAALFCMSIAVGLTPEMLPMIVNTNLARGAHLMSKQKCIVKRLEAIQNLGVIDVLCTDKTGTLTEDLIVLHDFFDPLGVKDTEVLKQAYRIAHHQTGLKNLLDQSIIDRVEKHTDVEMANHSDEFILVDEIPFDFKRRRMSIVLRSTSASASASAAAAAVPVSTSKTYLLCKGAVDEVLGQCTSCIVEKSSFFYHGGHAVVPFDKALQEKVHKLVSEKNADGQRVIAVASKWMKSADCDNFSVADESELTLHGFLTFFDPPKPSAKIAIEKLMSYGIIVKVLTGDNELVAKRTCKEVGLLSTNTLTGKQIFKMTDEQLMERLPETTIFSSLSPDQKARVVSLLKRTGKSCGFLGDGINDALALRTADVGISVDSASDLAKEAADIIMLEKNLEVLEQGVVLGRITHGNTLKYIKMAASSNFGNVFSVLIASAWLPFMPMLPIHILIQNFLYDVSQIAIPWDRMDEDYLSRPRPWSSWGIARFMLCVGPISSMFDLATFAFLWKYLHYNSIITSSLFQTGWFVEGLLTQVLIIHMIRTDKLPFISSSASSPVVFMTLLVGAAGIAIPNIPFIADAFALTALPSVYYLYLATALFSYCCAVQIVKMIYIRLFNDWI